MEVQEHKKWSRKIQGNRRLANDVKNPLRHYLENEIKKIDVSVYPDRPKIQVDLSIGDPTNSEDFRTHPSNIEILKKNVGKINGYTNFQGTQEAREAIINKFRAPSFNLTKDNVFLTHGGSMALMASMMLLANQGDNFLFPSPGFPLSQVIAKTFGIQIRPYHLQADNGWKADLKEIQSLIDDKTKFILLNDPSNPLGTCWNEKHKIQILQLCRKRKLPILADQIYEEVTYQEPSRTFAELATNQDVIFKCSGLTKRWLGPGWRLGWLIVYANEENSKIYIEALKRIFNIFLMPHTVMQASVKQILQNPNNEQHLKSRLEIMKQNKKLIRQQLSSQNYLTIGEASGALYGTLIMKMDRFKEEIPNLVEFCKKLYAEENIMIFPGIFFGSDVPFVRLTISCATDIIAEFIIRFKRFCSRYLKQ